MASYAEPMSDKKARILCQYTGTRLMQMHVQTGDLWFLVPGGRVRPEFADEFRKRPDVIEYDDGLFPGNPQSWRIAPAK